MIDRCCNTLAGGGQKRQRPRHSLVAKHRLLQVWGSGARAFDDGVFGPHNRICSRHLFWSRPCFYDCMPDPPSPRRPTCKEPTPPSFPPGYRLRSCTTFKTYENGARTSHQTDIRLQGHTKTAPGTPKAIVVEATAPQRRLTGKTKPCRLMAPGADGEPKTKNESQCPLAPTARLFWVAPNAEIDRLGVPSARDGPQSKRPVQPLQQQMSQSMLPIQLLQH